MIQGDVAVKNWHVGRYFLVGCPRSGTTLLRNLLSVHPQIASFPESHFFTRTVGVGNGIFGIALPGTKRRLYRYLDEIGHRELRQLIPFLSFSIKNYTKSFVDILDTLTINSGKNCWLEKTPRHLHFINTIEKYVSGAKFIHMVRNGKDVVASLYEITHRHPWRWGGPRGIKRCVLRWNKDAKITRQYLNRKNHLIVKYEVLTEKLQESLENICKFIGVDFQEDVLSLYQKTTKSFMWKSDVYKGATRETIRNLNDKKFYNIFNKKQRQYILNHLIELD